MPQMSKERDFEDYERGKLAGAKLLADLEANPSIIKKSSYLACVVRLNEEGGRHDFHKRGLVAILKAELAKK